MKRSSTCCCDSRVRLGVLPLCLSFFAFLYAAALAMPLRNLPFDATKQRKGDIRALEVGKPIEREMAGRESHTYRFALDSGQFIYAIVDQRGIDVVVTLSDPDGEKLVEMDSPSGGHGPERILWVAKTTGGYSLEVHPVEAKADRASYEIRIETLRIPTEEDLLRLKAEASFMEAEHLLEVGAAESIRAAFDKYKEALPLFQRLNDRDRENNVLLCFGVIHSWRGEVQEALDYYDQVLEHYRADGDYYGEVTTLVKAAELYVNLGESEKALDYYERSLRIRQEVGYHDGELIVINAIGEAYLALAQPRTALVWFDRAQAGWKADELPEWEAFALNNIGSAYYALGDYQKALDFFERALPQLIRYGHVRQQGRTLTKLGLVHYTTGDPEKAFGFFSKSLLASRAASDPFGEVAALYNLARVERDRGNLAESRSLIEGALNITESVRASSVSHEVRTSFLASVRDYYDFYIDLLMKGGGQQPPEEAAGAALQVAERARARSLLDILAESRADIRRGVDPLLLERERALRQLLNEKAEQQMRLLERKHTGEGASALAKEISGVTTELHEVEALIRRHSPRYAALTQPQPLSLREIQGLLDRDTLLLEYALGDERSYLWAVTPDSIGSYELPKRKEIESVARRVYQSLSAASLTIKGETLRSRERRLIRAEADFQKAAAGLSRIVLGPVAPSLGAKRLLIIADGALQYVPFAALPIPVEQVDGVGSERPGNRDGDREPAIVAHEIVSLPSASSIAVLRRELADRQPAPKAVAVLADPVFSRDDSRVKAPGRRAAPRGNNHSLIRDFVQAIKEAGVSRNGTGISRLPFSRREADAIKFTAPPGQALEAVDFDASRETATSAELSQYRIVHFATHGLLNSEHPELSGIVLSLVDRNGRPQNGFLRLHDVYNLNLPAELVVLSACQTGLGKEVKGEGLVGLTRGFMYAGAARVVASLWKVDDAATAELMRRFYAKMLGSELRPAAALRDAQVEMSKQKQWRNPYYWAGFVIQGEWR